VSPKTPLLWAVSTALREAFPLAALLPVKARASPSFWTSTRWSGKASPLFMTLLEAWVIVVSESFPLAVAAPVVMLAEPRDQLVVTAKFVSTSRPVGGPRAEVAR
jgi:hypothetical protein